MTVEDCRLLLRVSERTIRGWESGATRIPYAAYKLLRVLKGGRYLAHPYWHDFIVQGPTLITPEGRTLEAGDLSWWSLLVLQAQQWRNLFAEQRGQEPTSVAASMLGHCKAPKPLVRSKHQPKPAIAKGKRHSGPKLAPEPGAFHQPARATGHTDRETFPVGPSSNTGQKFAQIEPVPQIGASA